MNDLTSIRFGYGKSLSGVITKTKSWSDIAKVLMKPHRVYKDKSDATNAPNILGGPTDDRGKDMENILGRSLITLDYDDLPEDVSVDDFEFALDMLGYAAVAYTTFSHKTERADGKARIRVIVPMDQEVSVSDYPAVARALADDIGYPAAKESFSAACVMFLPSCAEGYEDEAWSHEVSGPPYATSQVISANQVTSQSDVDDDLLLDIAYEPLDLTDDEVDAALALLPAEGLDYDEWISVGLALWHQYRGDAGEAGFGRWLKWSEQSSKHNPANMRKKWKSGGGRSQPITMASVLSKVGGLSAVRDDDYSPDQKTPTAPATRSGILDHVEALCERASDIESLEDYDALKQTLLRIPETRLGADYRGMVADEIYTSWGKGAGLTKGDIKKALMPSTKRTVVAREDVDRSALTEADCWDERKPEWLRGWVFDETDAEFVQIDTGHAIKREAFRMKFDREPECEAHEVDAVALSSKYYPIPTITSRMYWPGQGRIFQDATGCRNYLNSWQVGGGSSVEPAEPGSFEVGDDSLNGQACEVFLDHLRKTIADERERALVLDWLAYVYSKPGARVRWALLLWGIEGNGKSYFHNILTKLMGQDAREIAASIIEERFTDWAEGCRVIGIEEIRVSGTNKWRTLDKMKPFISNDQIQIEGKGSKARTVPNFASYMLFTNHADAIPIGDGDRRYFVVFTKHRTRDELYDEHGGPEGVKAYFKRLFDVSFAGASGIARLLLDHEYSDEFDPHGRAPDSIGKEEMRLMHINEDDDALADALDEFQGPYINDKIIDITLLRDECDMSGEIELPKTNALAHKLVAMGYSKLGRIKVRKKMRTVWYKPGKISKANAEIAMKQGGVDDYDPDVPF